MSISACAQALLQRIVAAVGRRVGVDVLGGNRRPDEDEPVVEIRRGAAIFTEHGVEERLRALGLPVVDQEPDEVALDLLPQRVAVGAVKPGDAVFAARCFAAVSSTRRS